MNNQNRLINKVAIVTGASKGIGASIAEHLAQEGAKVIVNYRRDAAGAEKVVNRITSLGGVASSIQADVSSPEAVSDLFQKTEKIYGKIDILVNNAGVYEVASIDDFSVDLYRKQFDTNVLSIFLTTKEASTRMNSKGGSIINIGSIVGSMPPPGISVYAASKAAVDAISISHSRELGPKNIRVNSLNPGMTETEGLLSSSMGKGNFREVQAQVVPLGRIGQPEDIAKVAVFLASDESAWITGQIIIAAGGKRS